MNYENIVENDNHLFDTRRPFHGKDDVIRLKIILDKLNKLNNDSGYSSGHSNHSNNKMRCTYHSGRTHQKTGRAFSPRHNDRNFQTNPNHIVKDKTENNISWNYVNDCSFEEGEKRYYEEHFKNQLEYSNEKYLRNRHKERIKTIDEWRKCKQHCPEETIMQIGKINNHPDLEVSLKCFNKYIAWLNCWNKEHNEPFQILNWALHQDEQGAPHFHIRKVWLCTDPKSGLPSTGQEEALRTKCSIRLPYPEKPEGRKNNRKIVFDKICREKWIEICKEFALEIEDVPKPKEKVGMTLEEYRKREDMEREQIYKELINATEQNIIIAEKISEWDGIISTADQLSKVVEKKIYESSMAFFQDQRDKITDELIAAFAKANKEIKDKYEKLLREQKIKIKNYEKIISGDRNANENDYGIEY